MNSFEIYYIQFLVASSAHVILKWIRQTLRDAVSQDEKLYPQKMLNLTCSLYARRKSCDVGYHFSSWLTATLNLCLICFKIAWALSILFKHMHKKFDINHKKVKCGCHSGGKVVIHYSKIDCPLEHFLFMLKSFPKQFLLGIKVYLLEAFCCKKSFLQLFFPIDSPP